MCRSLIYGRFIVKINSAIGNIYGKIQSFFKVKKSIFSALKSVHKSVRQRRFTLETDFPEMGIPNYASESTKLMSLERAC